MRRKTIYSLLFLCLCACNKEDSNAKPDCQTNNYGIFRVNVSSTTLRHHIVVTVDMGTREKDLEAGILTDTLHLPPGTYSTFIASNDGTVPIDSDRSTVTIEQCKETVRNVPF